MTDVAALVTGAAGFLGRHVAQVLAGRGFRVCGLGHGVPAARDLAAWGIREWIAGGLSANSLEQMTRQPEVVIHCAGAGTVGQVAADPLADFRQTVMGTAELVEYLRLRATGARVVLCSSAAVYGMADKGPIEESRPVSPISAYGTHKLILEHTMAEWGAQFGLRVACVRLFSVYGEGARKQLLWDACRKFAALDRVFAGTGAETRDLVHVSDAAQLLLLAAERASPACPVVNGGTGVAPTLREVLGRAAKVLGIEGPAQFSGVRRPGDPPHLCANASLAESWGWRPTVPWEEGVRAYCEWYLRERSAQ